MKRYCKLSFTVLVAISMCLGKRKMRDFDER